MFGRRNNSADTAAAPAIPVPPSSHGGEELESLWQPAQSSVRKSVEQVLIERGQVTDEQFDQAKKVQEQTPGKSVVQILQTMNAVTEAQVLSAQAQTLGIEFETPNRAEIDTEAFALFSPEYMRKNAILPLRFEKETLIVGMSDPANVFLHDEIRRRTRRDVKIVAMTAADMGKTIELMTAGFESTEKVDQILKDVKEEDVHVVKEENEDAVDLAKAGNESPIIRFVNYLIADAIKQGASDIHIEPKEKALKIRYRIDGVLFESMNPPYQMTPAIVSRLENHGESRHFRAGACHRMGRIRAGGEQQ